MNWPHDPHAAIPAEYDGLIFDCDGTLVDTMPIHYRSWLHALGPHGVVFEESRFYGLAGMPTVAIIELLTREQNVVADVRAIARAKDEHYLAQPFHGDPIAPVVAIAQREQHARRLAVASGNVTRLVRETLRGAGIEPLFSAVIGADQVTRGKPAPDIFLRAAEQLGVSPARCVVYEDGDVGLEAARAAGMRGIDVRPWLK